MDLWAGKIQQLLAHQSAGGGRIVVDDEAIDADGALTRQQQLQRGIQRVAVDDDRTTAHQRSPCGGRNPRNGLGTNGGDRALHATGPPHR
jgi:hypothetical protein